MLCIANAGAPAVGIVNSCCPVILGSGCGKFGVGAECDIAFIAVEECEDKVYDATDQRDEVDEKPAATFANIVKPANTVTVG